VTDTYASVLGVPPPKELGFKSPVRLTAGDDAAKGGPSMAGRFRAPLIRTFTVDGMVTVSSNRNVEQERKRGCKFCHPSWSLFLLWGGFRTVGEFQALILVFFIIDLELTLTLLLKVRRLSRVRREA
jgi:hypothetical protein